MKRLLDPTFAVLEFDTLYVNFQHMRVMPAWDILTFAEAEDQELIWDEKVAASVNNKPYLIICNN